MNIIEGMGKITIESETKDSKALTMFVEAKIMEIKAFGVISEISE